MENDILDSLSDLGYEGPLSDEVAFSKALEGGPKSLEYTKLVHILAEELKKLCKLEETVSIMNDPDESSSFLLELSSFLKELGCPYKTLVTGHMSSRLQSKDERILLLDYLVSELMAARIFNVDCVKESTGMEIVMQESQTAADLKDLLLALKFNKPPPNITPDILFAKLETKLKETISKEGEKLTGKPLYNKALSDKEWKNLERTYNEMFDEYRLRRETLITRLECTIQSFEWSERLKSKTDLIQSAYRSRRDALKVKPSVKLSDLLAARTDLLLVEKTSSATVRKNTISDVNKVLIGKVPDRGGRPKEVQPPPPEMPSWTQRSAQGGRGGGRGGRGGGQERGGYGGQERGGRAGGQDRGGYGGQVHDGRGGGQDRGGYGGQDRGGYGGPDRGGYGGQDRGGRGGGQDRGGYGGHDRGGYGGQDRGGYGGQDRGGRGGGQDRGGYGGHDRGGRGGGQDRGGYGGHDRGGRGRGGRVQGGYNQSSGDVRFQSNQRNYQTYDVTGGYQTGYSDQNQGYDNQYNQGYNQNYNQYNNQGRGGYQGYQNEHDDRERRRGGYSGRR